MTKGLVVLFFMIFVVIIIFLAFQVNANSTQCRELRTSHQDKITKAARLLLQSATQQHDVFAHEHAQEAKFIIDDVIHEHGGVGLAEKNLKLTRGKLEHLRNQIYNQFNEKQSVIMEHILRVYPQLDVPENEEAGLRRHKKRKLNRK